MGRLFVALLLGGLAAPELGLAAPELGLAAPEPGPAAPTLAVQWREDGPRSDPAQTALKLELREVLAARDGRPVELIADAALAQARRVAAHTLPLAVRERATGLRDGLDRADASYRAGDFEAAEAEAGAALDLLHAHPEQPGAVASAREAQLLLAKIAWAQGQPERAEQALHQALRIDPSATLSTRAAPPALVERYEDVQRALLESAPSWPTPALGQAEDADTIILEIDGVEGARPVPPGPHFVVARRDGYAPIAAWRDVGEVWALPRFDERVPDDLAASVAAVCEVLALDALVLAERRGQRVGVQVYDCDDGGGPLWVGDAAAISDGVAVAMAGGRDHAEPLALFEAWPDPPAPRVTVGVVEPQAPRPWFRKGWVWGTSAGVVGLLAGAVVAGVLISGRPTVVEVDATPFIGGGS